MYRINGSKEFSFIKALQGALRSIQANLQAETYEVMNDKREQEAIEAVNNLAKSLGLDLTITRE